MLAITLHTHTRQLSRHIRGSVPLSMSDSSLNNRLFQGVVLIYFVVQLLQLVVRKGLRCIPLCRLLSWLPDVFFQDFGNLHRLREHVERSVPWHSKEPYLAGRRPYFFD